MNGLGMKMGYALVNRTLPNPIDMVLVPLQRVFPLDYILILIVTWFLLLCTMSGIRNLGIRVFGIKMYSLKRRKTRPQGLLLTCVTLIMTVLAINIFVYMISPQYTTFGNQRYIAVDNGTAEYLESTNITTHVKSCDLTTKPDQCTMTRNSALLTRFFYKVKLTVAEI